MEAKYKAMKIISTYFDIISPIYNYDKDGKFNSELFLQIENKCKEVALICVDEIINSIEVGYEDYKSLSKINYYQEVKEEIQKL